MRPGDLAAALAAAFATYAGLLCLLASRHFFLSYGDVVLGVGLSILAAYAARRAAREQGSHALAARCLRVCRTASAWTRFPGAVALVLLAVVFDRYLDGDPDHFRLSTFVVPVIVSVIVFDLRATVFAIATSVLALDFCMMQPIYQMELSSLSDALDLALYLFIFAQIAIAVERFVGAENASSPRSAIKFKGG